MLQGTFVIEFDFMILRLFRLKNRKFLFEKKIWPPCKMHRVTTDQPTRGKKPDLWVGTDLLNHTNLLHKSVIFGAIFWDPTSSHIYGIHFIMVPYAYAKKYKKIVMRYHAAFEKNTFYFFRPFDLKLVPFSSMN